MGISLACLGGQLACCFARRTASCFHSLLRPSTATRLCYSIQFFFATLLAWILMTWGYRLPKTVNPLCDRQCWSYLVVMRISLSLALFHTLMSLVVWNVRSSRQWRARLQNGWWPVKIICWILLLVLAFQLPDSAYFHYHIAAMVFSALFIIFQSMLLVDFAWSLAQRLIDGWEETGRPLFKRLLLGGCATMYSIAFTVSTLLLVYFGPPAKPQCGLNSYFTGVNLILICIQSLVAVLPRIQEMTPRSGLFQSALLAAYTTYLTASAVNSAPADESGGVAGCGGTRPALDGWMRAVGVLTTFLALGYYAFSAGSSTFFHQDNSGDTANDYYYGALPTASASSPPSDGNDNGDEEDADDEQSCVAYNYTLFHLSFMMASFYMAMILTDWSVVVDDWSKPNGIAIQRGFNGVWVKVVMSWLCSLLYLWTLVAPLVFPERDFSI